MKYSVLVEVIVEADDAEVAKGRAIQGPVIGSYGVQEIRLYADDGQVVEVGEVCQTNG